MANIKQFNTPNGEKVGLNLTKIGAVIEDSGSEKELKAYIDENAGGGSAAREIVVLTIATSGTYSDLYNYAAGLVANNEDLGKVFDKYILTTNPYGNSAIRPQAYEIYFSTSDNVLYVRMLSEKLEFTYLVSENGSCEELYKGRVLSVNNTEAGMDGNVEISAGGGTQKYYLNNMSDEERSALFTALYSASPVDYPNFAIVVTYNDTTSIMNGITVVSENEIMLSGTYVQAYHNALGILTCQLNSNGQYGTWWWNVKSE